MHAVLKKTIGTSGLSGKKMDLTILNQIKASDSSDMETMLTDDVASAVNATDQFPVGNGADIEYRVGGGSGSSSSAMNGGHRTSIGTLLRNFAILVGITFLVIICICGAILLFVKCRKAWRRRRNRRLPNVRYVHGHQNNPGRRLAGLQNSPNMAIAASSSRLRRQPALRRENLIRDKIKYQSEMRLQELYSGQPRFNHELNSEFLADIDQKIIKMMAESSAENLPQRSGASLGHHDPGCHVRKIYSTPDLMSSEKEAEKWKCRPDDPVIFWQNPNKNRIFTV